MKNILLALAAIGVYYFVSKENAGEKLNVLFKKIGISGGSLYCYFNVQNPSSTQINVNSLVGDLAVNGKYLSNISSFDKVAITPNSQVELKVKVSISIIDVIRNISALINSGGKITAIFKGNVNADGFTIPVNQTVIG